MAEFEITTEDAATRLLLLSAIMGSFDAGQLVTARSLMGITLQTSTSDATPGRTLQLGAFGLGTAGTVLEMPDLDAIDTPTGNYYYAATTTNLASKPAASAGTGTVIVTRAFASASTQVLTENIGVAAGGDTWYRTYSGGFGAWSSWRLLFDSANILGTVSESAGVPTGAIIEEGSNANGSYTRFADGTQICTHVKPFLYNSVKRMNVVWTFPAVFVSTPSTSAILDITDLLANSTPQPEDLSIITKGSGTTINSTLWVYRITGSVDFAPADTCLAYLQSVGRWF